MMDIICDDIEYVYDTNLFVEMCLEDRTYELFHRMD